MRNLLSVYGFGHDLEKIRYPYLSSIQSALELTRLANGIGSVYYCECDSTDDSFQNIKDVFRNQIRDGELVLLAHSWGDHHTVQAYICNYILDVIGTKTRYALKMDMDEVLCEWSYQRFLVELNYMDLHDLVLGKPHYTHFSPDPFTTFPFIYRSKAVISLTDAKLRFDTQVGGDACALGGAGLPEFQTHLELAHYGKMDYGRPAEALYKEQTFTKLYYDRGFPDPKVDAQAHTGRLDYLKVFDVAKQNGEFQPYTGSHPSAVKGWLELMKLRHEAFLGELNGNQA